jgi:hypothetical protein
MHRIVKGIIDGSTYRPAGKWNWTSWMLAAAQAKLDHRERSRGRRRRRPRNAGEVAVDPNTANEPSQLELERWSGESPASHRTVEPCA